MPRDLLPADKANQYGFDWPPIDDPRGSLFREGAHIQAVRMSSIKRSNGVYRVLQVLTERTEVHVYVTPTGRVRVFEDGKGEMKHGPKTRKRKGH
jgi:hypothetical protein